MTIQVKTVRHAGLVVPDAEAVAEVVWLLEPPHAQSAMSEASSIGMTRRTEGKETTSR